MTNEEVRKFALDLLHADSESSVIEILKKPGYWDDPNAWRLYGDKEGNFAQAGNQQALPEAALVEKIVNCCDSRLMCECLTRGIDPESDQAPTSVRDAVAMFFEERRAIGDQAGTLANWRGSKRTEQSRFITIAATGDRPTRGQRTRNMCITIADQAEGQSPLRLPKTILSLNEKNKQRIRFVQGKFNMGGSGALRFCGELGLQLVISRRNPVLAMQDRGDDPSVNDWGITVVRREEPSNKSGDPVHSEFTYLAPLDTDQHPRKGNVLRFKAETLPLMPEHDEPYKRQVSFGSAIKLYEYETSVGKSNVLLKDGLMYSLERLLPEIALPIRIHECRGYKGEKERSFETPIAGLVVRLEDGKGDNLEPGFPLSVKLQVRGMPMTARIYAFKETSAATYLRDEGVIFTINGQAHGYLPKSIFSRPKAVGLPRLRDALLVLVDCTSLSVTQRENLFMSSRDRLSKKPIRIEVEQEIEQLLKTNPELKRLQQERREHDVQLTLSDDKPLEEVIGRILAASPTLRSLFLQGRRLPRPFASGGGGGGGDGDNDGAKKGEKEFRGERHPSYFRIPEVATGGVFRRTCEDGRRCRIAFETDVENEYFDRATDRGIFHLDIVDASRQLSEPSFSLALEDGSAHLNMALPRETEVGDQIVLQATVRDPAIIEPLVSMIQLTVAEKQEHVPPSARTPTPKHSGSGVNDSSQQGIKLPTPIPVHENDENWKRHHFTLDTSCHVESDPVEVGGKTVVDHIFFINVDNTSLKTEMKYSNQNARLLEAKFKYANVLLGLAMLYGLKGDSHPSTNGDDSAEENEKEPVQDTIRRVSSALAPVLLPMIDQLSGLTEEQLEEFSTTGEDA